MYHTKCYVEFRNNVMVVFQMLTNVSKKHTAAFQALPSVRILTDRTAVFVNLDTREMDKQAVNHQVDNITIHNI